MYDLCVQELPQIMVKLQREMTITVKKLAQMTTQRDDTRVSLKVSCTIIYVAMYYLAIW